MKKVSLLGIDISTASKAELLNSVKNFLEKKQTKPLTIVTPNPEQVVLAQNDKHFREILNKADIALPDGNGIVWAHKLVHRRQFTEGSSQLAGDSSQIADDRKKLSQTTSYELRTNIPGIEFMESLIEMAAENGYSIGLIGGWDNVAQKTLNNLQQRLPKLKGWAEEGPEIEVHSSQFTVCSSNNSEEKYFREIIAKIKQQNTRMLFIGLGAPKQEYFMERLSSQFAVGSSQIASNLVLMSVGGSFDELSGKIPRAPQLVSNAGLKWLWRLILEPWRIGRQLRLVQFAFLTFFSHK